MIGDGFKKHLSTSKLSSRLDTWETRLTAVTQVTKQTVMSVVLGTQQSDKTGVRPIAEAARRRGAGWREAGGGGEMRRRVVGRFPRIQTWLRRSLRSPLLTWSYASSFLPRQLRMRPFIACVSAHSEHIIVRRHWPRRVVCPHQPSFTLLSAYNRWILKRVITHKKCRFTFLILCLLLCIKFTIPKLINWSAMIENKTVDVNPVVSLAADLAGYSPLPFFLAPCPFHISKLAPCPV